jgi:hypothetical protein
MSRRDASLVTDIIMQSCNERESVVKEKRERSGLFLFLPNYESVDQRAGFFGRQSGMKIEERGKTGGTDCMGLEFRHLHDPVCSISHH